ncbi:MAG TPA: NADH-quinone oxidoreductase subunit C [Mycobacteriales bacterium]
MNLAAIGVVGEEFGDPVVDVDRDDWLDAVQRARATGLTYLDMLTAVDDGDVFTVVTYLWSTADRAGVLLRTTVPRSDPTLASITPLFAGADWHERETAEMYGLTFAGHPRPGPLLLPDPVDASSEVHPLRKENVLTRRVETPWPGAADLT